jgi:hypothetical protein
MRSSLQALDGERAAGRAMVPANSPARLRVYTTGPIEEDWIELGYKQSGLKHLMKLVELTATQGVLHEPFTFGKFYQKAGIYIRPNLLGLGWLSYAYYEEQAPIYLLRLRRTKSEVEALVGNHLNKKLILSQCEANYKEWVAVR